MGRIVLILVLVGLHALLGAPDYLLSDAGSLRAVASYSFFHASWLHLAVNCLAVSLMFMPSLMRSHKYNIYTELASGILIAMAVAPLSMRPPVGFSNVLYAVVGLRTPSFSHPWWRKRPVIFFFILTAVLIPFPQVAGLTHVAALAAGVLLAVLRRFYHSLTDDVRRYI